MNKNIKLIIILMIISNSLICQNLIDPTTLPLHNPFTPDTIVDFNDGTVFNKNFNDFIIGWNYGDTGNKLDNLFNINYYLYGWETGIAMNWNYYGNNNNWYLRIRPLGYPDDSGVGSCPAVLYDPAISVNTDENFTPDANSKGGSVFGFQNKNSNLTISNQNLIVPTTLSTSQPILSNIWPKNILKFWHDFGNYPDSYEGHGAGDNRNDFNGKELFLSINLKSSQMDLSSKVNFLDTPLLTLKIKYYARDKDNGDTLRIDYIKFKDTIGNTPLTISSSLNINRGKRRTEVALLAPKKEFVITPRMLVTSGTTTASEFITLSSGFSCNYNPLIDNPIGMNDLSNPYLFQVDQSTIDETSEPINDYSWHIDSMDIEVYYNNTPEIGLEVAWIKLETPRARDLFRGVEDRYIRFKICQADSLFRTQPTGNNGRRIAGFYANDEYDKHLWLSSRYFNMLVDTMSNAEVNKEYITPPHFLHSTGFKSFWNGNNVVSSCNGGTPVPFIKYGNHDDNTTDSRKTFNWKSGYAGYYSESGNKFFSIDDIKNSKYETNLYNNATFNNVDFDHWYADGKLFSYEKFIKNNYYSRKSLLFGNKQWQAWLWVNSTWTSSLAFNSIYNYDYTPLTGEELSLQAFYPIALGAKGEFFWHKTRPYNNNFNSTESIVVDINLQPTNSDQFNDNLVNISENDILTHQEMYGDYFDFSNPAYDSLYKFNANTNLNLYEWSKMNISSDRLYLGLNTIRTGLKKHTDWITKNHELLMSLRLMAWRGKGFSTMYQQADGLEMNYINKFIDVSQIKTRPLGYERNGVPFYEQNMSPDSSFYDIMIHRIGETSLDDSLVIAVINRRTDPLVYVNDELPYQSEDQYEEGTFYSQDFKFYSTHEYDSFCDNGGNQKRNPITGEMKSTNYWREKYWQRFGCRSFAIPLNLPNIAYGNGAYLQAKEIGLDKMDSLGVWFDEPYYHRIDTIIPNNGVLISKHLPGQGKIIELQKKTLFEDTCNICDVVNDFELINFRVHKYLSDPPNCCYEIILEKESSCPFDSVPIKIIASGIESAEFENSPMTDSTTNIKYRDLELSTATNGSYNLGNLCVNSTEPATLEIVFGSNCK